MNSSYNPPTFNPLMLNSNPFNIPWLHIYRLLEQNLAKVYVTVRSYHDDKEQGGWTDLKNNASGYSAEKHMSSCKEQKEGRR